MPTDEDTAAIPIKILQVLSFLTCCSPAICHPNQPSFETPFSSTRLSAETYSNSHQRPTVTLSRDLQFLASLLQVNNPTNRADFITMKTTVNWFQSLKHLTIFGPLFHLSANSRHLYPILHNYNRKIS